MEEIGIEYSKQAAEEADLILFLYDSSQGLNKEDKTILELIKDKQHIKIANKADLEPCQESPLTPALSPKGRGSVLKANECDKTIKFSTVTKQGFDELKTKIKDIIGEKSIEDIEFITNSRQQNCLVNAKESLNQALLAIQIKELQDLISIDIKSALLYLEEITGEVITDDILNNIFDNFCIGK